jgi:hypothetical protein
MSEERMPISGVMWLTFVETTVRLLLADRIRSRPMVRQYQPRGIRPPIAEEHIVFIDTFPDRANPNSYWNRFRTNVLLREDAAKVHVHIGSTTSFLLGFVQRGGGADFIYVDAPQRAPDVLSDLILAFRCLRLGGVLICYDYLGGSAPDDHDLTLGSPKIAVDTFTTIFRPQIEIIAGQPLYQVALVKRRELLDEDPASRGESSRGSD